MFQNIKARIAGMGSKLAAGVAVSMVSAASFAQTSGNDPTSTLVSTLGTYATDVGLLAVAILTIAYGKKLVGYLKV